MVRVITVVVGTLLAAGLAGCGIDRGAYVKVNERLFEQLPSLPGARLDRETSTAYRSSDLGRLLATTRGSISFFQERLRPRWRLVGAIGGLVFNFRSGAASVSINLFGAQGHILEVAVDHAYYGKLGR